MRMAYDTGKILIENTLHPRLYRFGKENNPCDKRAWQPHQAHIKTVWRVVIQNQQAGEKTKVSRGLETPSDDGEE